MICMRGLSAHATNDRLCRPLLMLALMTGAVPATAQNATNSHVATSSAGQAGHRQTKELGVTGIEPMARIDNRIQNRVQSRLRNRLDRYYDPQANAASPFAIASDKARRAGKPNGH